MLDRDDILHMHPPFWWAGMKESVLQVLLHGDGIGEFDVELDCAEGVELNEVARFDNPNYVLLYLDIADACSQTFKILLTKGDARCELDYELKERCDCLRTPFDSSDVVYLLMPDRFAREEGSACNPHMKMRERSVCSKHPDTRHGGNIAGMDKRLDYLADLGVTAIWHTPTLENDMRVCQNWHILFFCFPLCDFGPNLSPSAIFTFLLRLPFPDAFRGLMEPNFGL